MPNIQPISDLRNYNSVLHNVSVGEPVFLTKNGRGKFAVLEIGDYERMCASLELLSKLHEGERSAIPALELPNAERQAKFQSSLDKIGAKYARTFEELAK